MNKDLVKKHLDLLKLRTLVGVKGLAFLLGKIHKVEERLANIQLIKGDKGDSIQGAKGDKGDRGDVGPAGENGRDGKDGIDGKHGRDGVNGKDGRDGQPGAPGKPGKDGTDGKDGLPPTEEVLKDLITPLIPQASEIAKNVVQTPAKAFRIYTADCSAQCDGSNKTFSVGGSHFGIVAVYGTEFPIIYRPIVDYTETRTGFTLTSAVSGPASGQTLIATFLK